jgi:hypothetical protein
MRELIAILEGPAQSKSEEPALLQPQNPPMPKPAKVLHVKKTTITKHLKAQDGEKAKANEAIRKAVSDFATKNAPSKSRAASQPPKRQSMPTLSFDEIAEQLDAESFLDNPLDRKRDTRKRDELTSRGASSSARPASSSVLTRAASSTAAVRPASASRILKTQRADSTGQRRTTLETRLR